MEEGGGECLGIFMKIFNKMWNGFDVLCLCGNAEILKIC